MTSIKNTHKCSPKIWAKMNSTQKMYFNHFYVYFFLDINYPPDIMAMKKQKEHRHVIAHNLAFQTINALSDFFKF